MRVPLILLFTSTVFAEWSSFLYKCSYADDSIVVWLDKAPQDAAEITVFRYLDYVDDKYYYAANKPFQCSKKDETVECAYSDLKKGVFKPKVDNEGFFFVSLKDDVKATIELTKPGFYCVSALFNQYQKASSDAKFIQKDGSNDYHSILSFYVKNTVIWFVLFFVLLAFVIAKDIDVKLRNMTFGALVLLSSDTFCLWLLGHENTVIVQILNGITILLFIASLVLTSGITISYTFGGQDDQFHLRYFLAILMLMSLFGQDLLYRFLGTPLTYILPVTTKIFDLLYSWDMVAFVLPLYLIMLGSIFYLFYSVISTVGVNLKRRDVIFTVMVAVWLFGRLFLEFSLNGFEVSYIESWKDSLTLLAYVNWRYFCWFVGLVWLVYSEYTRYDSKYQTVNEINLDSAA